MDIIISSMITSILAAIEAVKSYVMLKIASIPVLMSISILVIISISAAMLAGGLVTKGNGGWGVLLLVLSGFAIVMAIRFAGGIPN